MKKSLIAVLSTGILSLSAATIFLQYSKINRVDAASAQPGFTDMASYTRPMHFSDPLTNDGNATYGNQYLNCYLSVERADTGLDFDLAWTGTINEHSWFTIVLGNTSERLYNNVTMNTNYDKFMIKPIAGYWALGAPGILKSPTNKVFYDWPVDANDGWTSVASYNYDAGNKNVTFHVDYNDLNTMSTKTDDTHIFAVQFYHHPDADPAVNNTLMGANEYWMATDINGTCSGDINVMSGNPLISQCAPHLAISEFAPTHTWSVGAKYGSEGCITYHPHSATNEYYCEISRDDTNKELVLDVHSAGMFEIANSNTLYKNIQFIFTTTNSNQGGWSLNANDLIARVYRKDATTMFADVVTGDLVNVWTVNESELFPDFPSNTYSYNYENHTIATPKSTFVEDTEFGTHFRIVYDLNDTDLALLTGDFKVEGVPFTGTDGVWAVNHFWDRGGNEYFGSTISANGDMAAQASYVTINNNYFAIQDALHYFFDNVNRDANYSMCSILSDNTRLNNVINWYQNLNQTVVDKLAITPDYRVTVKNTLDYIMTTAHANNPFASGSFNILNMQEGGIAIILIAVSATAFIATLILVLKKKKHAK